MFFVKNTNFTVLNIATVKSINFHSFFFFDEKKLINTLDDS